MKKSFALLLTLCLLLMAGCVHNEATKSNDPVMTTVESNAGRVNVPNINSHQPTVPANSSVVTAIAAGNNHCVALKSDGTVVVWGTTDTNYSGLTTVPAGLSGVTAVAAGFLHTVALKGDGTVVVWGSIDHFNLHQMTVPIGLAGVMAIAAGAHYTVALKSNGTLVAWGNTMAWKINGTEVPLVKTNEELNVPAGLSGVTAVSGGLNHIVALKSDGTVVTWGDNREGQTNVPAGLSGVTAIAAGLFNNVALKSDGTVVTWGNNYSPLMKVPTGLSGVTAISVSSSHAVALKSDGTVVIWGNDFPSMKVPTGLSGVTAISAGERYTAALKRDGTVVAWGIKSVGQTDVPAELSVVVTKNADNEVPVKGFPPTPTLPNEVDTLTFIKAFAQGKAAQYEGYKVLGGGASGGGKAGEDGNYLVVLVCGKRPNGEFYQIEKTAGGEYNFDGDKDELFAVQLEFRTLPPGTSAIAMLLGGGDLTKSFVARFNGKSTTASLALNGQEGRQVRVPVLVWEAKGTSK